MYYEIKNEMIDRLVLQRKNANIMEQIKHIKDILSEYGDEVKHELNDVQELEKFYVLQGKHNEAAEIDPDIITQIENKIDDSIESIKKNVIPTYDQLVYVTMAKNEAPYIREWIEYHKLVGVTKFYIYDHESEDNLFETLKEYIDRGEVIYRKWDKDKFHTECFNDAFQKYKYSAKYIGFIDCDEFVVPVKKDTITEVVDELMMQDSHCGGIDVNWVLYGTSGHEVKPEGLVTENFTMRMQPGYCKEIKTILNPRKITGFPSMHYANYKEGYYAVNEKGQKTEGPFNFNFSIDKIRINHYYTKSKEEFLKKSQRGKSDDGKPISMYYFNLNNQNEIYDEIMIPYVQRIKEQLDKKK